MLTIAGRLASDMEGLVEILFIGGKKTLDYCSSGDLTQREA